MERCMESGRVHSGHHDSGKVSSEHRRDKQIANPARIAGPTVGNIHTRMRHDIRPDRIEGQSVMAPIIKGVLQVAESIVVRAIHPEVYAKDIVLVEAANHLPRAIGYQLIARDSDKRLSDPAAADKSSRVVHDFPISIVAGAKGA